LNPGKNYYITTFGCQMNEHDSEVISAILESTGYCKALTPEDADLIIINTCAVRKKPEDKVSSLLGKYSDLKAVKKDLLIAVGGCMTQQEEIAQYIKERFHHVDLIFGTHALPHLPRLLAEAGQKKETVIDIEEYYSNRDNLPVLQRKPFQAWLPVIYGCNNYCSYCVVPFVRGRERSRKFEEIITEAQSLAEKGYVEITLLGQNVNSYGHDLETKYTFADLLAELNKIKGLERIRFLTSHPKDLSSQLIETVSRGDKICEHFHLPVQSGSNSILDKMNRRYNREQYLDLVKDIKNKIPGVSITSDIIVGFPGETEDNFLETIDLIQQVRFDNAFTFIYSPRRKTAAENLKDNLSRSQKESRLQRLNKIQHDISKEVNSQLNNKIVEVLVEGPSKTNPKVQTGRTRTNKNVHFTGSTDLAGKLLKIKITNARTWDLFGNLEGDTI
jgi:tRNA-2-methylthio-N6-dimethylallyladenosine synthase